MTLIEIVQKVVMPMSRDKLIVFKLEGWVIATLI